VSLVNLLPDKFIPHKNEFELMSLLLSKQHVIGMHVNQGSVCNKKELECSCLQPARKCERESGAVPPLGLSFWGCMHNNILVYAETSCYVGINKFETN